MTDLRSNFTEEDLREYAPEISYAENAGLSLAQLDGWIDLEKFLDERVMYDEYCEIDAMLWGEHDIDCIGIDEAYKEDEYIRSVIKHELDVKRRKYGCHLM